MRKVLVTFLTIGSLLGISAVTAMAEENTWTITVEVEDSSPTPCVADVRGATWSPDPLISYTTSLPSYDVYMGPAPADLQFTVSLAFMNGSDANACPDSPASYPPTGTIDSYFTSATLSMLSMECRDDQCNAGDASSDVLTGIHSAPTSEGTYTGTLRVVWTP